MQYAKCGREFLPNQAKRLGEEIKHIGPERRLQIRPTAKRFRTLCGLGIESGTWWYVNQESDTWCINCLVAMRMPYTLHNLSDGVKIYVLTKTPAHYNRWLHWVSAQMSDITFKPTKIFPIQGKASIDTKTSANYSFLYYVSGYLRQDFIAIDEKIRVGLGATPKCAICYELLQGQDFHEQCLLPMHTWENGRIQTVI